MGLAHMDKFILKKDELLILFPPGRYGGSQFGGSLLEHPQVLIGNAQVREGNLYDNVFFHTKQAGQAVARFQI
jgi:hypothetical protein